MSKYEHEEILDKMYDRLYRFFGDFFGLTPKIENLDHINFPTFEEVLGIIDLALNREESYKSYGLSLKKPVLRQIREDLIFLIALVIDEKIKTKGWYHRILLDRLKEEGKLSNTCFFSLNYDIIIDNAIIELYPDYDLDYGVDFTNYKMKDRNIDKWKRPRRSRAISLYKLHGSLNWLYCPTCISLTLTPKEKAGAKLVFEPQECKNCNGEMTPIIIPPTFFKVMSNYYLQRLWHKSEDALKGAKRIFFCGYSFPDADIHIKYLLKRAEVNRASSLEVFIINDYDEKEDNKRQAERLRYGRFFRDCNKINYTKLSFQDFCNKGIVE